MTSILAIDPGTHTGWALLFAMGGWHVAAAGVASPDDRDWPPFSDPDIVVIENPVIYPHSRARPADILKLARIVGRYEERFHKCRKQLVEPRAWKGTVNGDIMCRRIEADMTDRDRQGLASYKGGYRHNAIDAIGLGKWATRQPWARLSE